MTMLSLMRKLRNSLLQFLKSKKMMDRYNQHNKLEY